MFCCVLDVGEGYYDEKTGKDIPLDMKVGDIILVGPMSVTWYKNFGPIITNGLVGMTRQSEVKERYFGKEGYAKVFGVLGSSV